MTKKPSKLYVRWPIRLAAPLLLTITVALAIWMVAGVWASFSPQASIELSSLDSGAHANVTSNFKVPKGDVQFDAVATYLPPEWGVALDADVPDGIEVGTLDATAHLGIALGGATCNTLLTPKFKLLEATTKGTAFTSTGDMVGGTWNGYDKVCDGNTKERAICQYPDILDELFPARPIARYYGHTVVMAGIDAALNFLVFEPGTNLGGGIPSDPSWGYITVTVLNEGGVARPAVPGSLADNCTELISNNTVNGEAGGVALRTNPPYGGTYVFRSWSRGQPDADGDGLENAFDTCPYVDNLGDPRVAFSGDGDGDGLDTACDEGKDDDTDGAVNDGCAAVGDPEAGDDCANAVDDDGDDRANDGCPAVDAPETPGAQCNDGPGKAQTDVDGDGYHNRADNCPLIANGQAAGQENQKDTDGDGIGDICDNNPTSIDGTRPTKTIEDAVQIEGPAAPTGTATVTTTATGTATPTPTGTATGTVTGTPPPAGEGCTPVIPGTYNGLVRLNGVPAASGYEVTASIGGTEWGSATVSGGRYAIDVPDHLPAAAPCFEAGTITFAIDGATCTPTEQWGSGLHDLDLSCAAAATPTPGTATPTATPGTPVKTPTATPAKPPVTGGGGLGGDQDLPLWVVIVAGWAGLMALAGVGTLATRIVKR